MVYGIKSVDYLVRARSLLDTKDNAALFYVAFELRCGIEARLKEYFDGQAETTKLKRAGWKIDKLAKQVENVFKLNSNKGLRLEIFDAETNAPITTVLYTPVTPQLRKMAERLGGYLHSQNVKEIDTEPYWAAMRKQLEMTYQELRFATSGVLLAPPLAHPTNKEAHFFCLAGDQTNILPPGKQIGIHWNIYEVDPLNEADF